LCGWFQTAKEIDEVRLTKTDSTAKALPLQVTIIICLSHIAFGYSKELLLRLATSGRPYLRAIKVQVGFTGPDNNLLFISASSSLQALGQAGRSADIDIPGTVHRLGGLEVLLVD
jgi:hypothetical protein